MFMTGWSSSNEHGVLIMQTRVIKSNLRTTAVCSKEKVALPQNDYNYNECFVLKSLLPADYFLSDISLIAAISL